MLPKHIVGDFHGLLAWLQAKVIVKSQKESDAIFIPGSPFFTESLARGAYDLFRKKVSTKIIVTGGFKNYRIDESKRITSELLRLGIPECAIVSEGESTNTLENVICGMKAATLSGLKVESVFAVALPHHVKRCWATLVKQCQGVVVQAISAPMPIEDLIRNHQPRFLLTAVISEVDKLELYMPPGHIAKVDIPDFVRQHHEVLKAELANLPPDKPFA